MINNSYAIEHLLLSAGITPICGWNWVTLHWHDLDGWTPRFELKRNGECYSFRIRPQDYNKHTVRDVMKEVKS